MRLEKLEAGFQYRAGLQESGTRGITGALPKQCSQVRKAKVVRRGQFATGRPEHPKRAGCKGSTASEGTSTAMLAGTFGGKGARQGVGTGRKAASRPARGRVAGPQASRPDEPAKLSGRIAGRPSTGLRSQPAVAGCRHRLTTRRANRRLLPGGKRNLYTGVKHWAPEQRAASTNIPGRHMSAGSLEATRASAEVRSPPEVCGSWSGREALLSEC